MSATLLLQLYSAISATLFYGIVTQRILPIFLLVSILYNDSYSFYQ